MRMKPPECAGAVPPAAMICLAEITAGQCRRGATTPATDEKPRLRAHPDQKSSIRRRQGHIYSSLDRRGPVQRSANVSLKNAEGRPRRGARSWPARSAGKLGTRGPSRGCATVGDQPRCARRAGAVAAGVAAGAVVGAAAAAPYYYAQPYYPAHCYPPYPPPYPEGCPY